jgi:transcriptional regulator with XRE-family HTH domain
MSSQRPPRYPELAAEIARTGIHRYRIAADAEMPASVLSAIVSGRRCPSPAQRARLAAVLHRPETFLFCESDAGSAR